MKGCRPLTAEEVALIQRSVGGVYGARDRALFGRAVRVPH
jgi:hypothetical protein